MNPNSDIKQGRATIFLLAAIAALGSLATQLLVPALPLLAHDLHASASDAQLVIGVFLIHLGVGQLLAGPLADRWGRKPVLLAGLALYCLGSAAAAMAGSLALLLMARALQALGASAGIITARVLVSDLFADSEAMSAQATLMAVVLISPALAPVIGGTLTELIGWRAIFAVLAVAGLLGAGMAWASLPEGRAPSANAARPGLRGSYALLLKNRAFLGAAMAITGGSSALYMFLGTAPFLLAHQHHLSPRQIGLCLLLVAVMSIIATFAVKRVERRGNALLLGSVISASGGFALLALAIAGMTGLAAFIGPMLLLGLGAGLIGPSGITRVMRALPGLEGTAASLAGAAQMLIGALATYALGLFAPVSALHLGAAIALTTGVAVFAATLGGKPAARTM